MIVSIQPLATFPALRHKTSRQSRGVHDIVYLAKCKDNEKDERRINRSRRSLMAASVVLTATLLASTPTSSFAASSSSSLCTVEAAGESGDKRLSFFRGLLGSSPEAPCGIEEVLESGRAGGGEGEAFRKRRSDDEQRKERRERGGEEASSSSSPSFDERAALEEERQRATQDFVESMWQGLE